MTSRRINPPSKLFPLFPPVMSLSYACHVLYYSLRPALTGYRESTNFNENTHLVLDCTH